MEIPDGVFNFVGLIFVMMSTSWLTLKLGNVFTGDSLGLTPRAFKFRSIRALVALIIGVYLIFAF